MVGTYLHWANEVAFEQHKIYYQRTRASSATQDGQHPLIDTFKVCKVLCSSEAFTGQPFAFLYPQVAVSSGKNSQLCECSKARSG